MHHARWLARADRILHYFMSQKNPTNNLILLVDYIVTVYAPSWFEIKKNWQCFNASQNFYFMVQCVAKIKDQRVKDVAQSALLRNSYFCHL